MDGGEEDMAEIHKGTLDEGAELMLETCYAPTATAIGLSGAAKEEDFSANAKLFPPVQMPADPGPLLPAPPPPPPLVRITIRARQAAATGFDQ